MLKALLKKQFLELNTFYFIDKKTGKPRSKGKTALYIGLFAVLFIYLGVVFYMLATAFAPFLSTDYPWLYFSLLGMLTLLFSVFGSVFNTYAGLYHAKDNDLLLSMPIPPSRILFVRLLGVGAMSLLYGALIYIPALIVRFVAAPVTVSGVIGAVLLLPLITVLSVGLTCLLGWVVAQIAGRLKNKSVVTVVLSLAIFFAYYYGCMQASSLIQVLMAQGEAVSAVVRTWLRPFWYMGRAGEGDWAGLALFALIAVGLFAIVYWLLARTFIGIATRSGVTATKKVYREQTIKSGSVAGALLRKEWKRYTGSALYVLNCSLCTFIMPIAGVVLLVRAPALRAALAELEAPSALVVPLLAAALCLMSSMNDLTAPSVSLEGKMLWVLRSMPVSAVQVLNAKQALHLLLTVPPVIFTAVCVSITLRLPVLTAILLTLIAVLFAFFSAAFGLIFGLKMPSLSWTNETMPIKQSGAVMAALFGCMGVSGVIAGVGLLLAKFLPADAVLGTLAALLAGTVYLLNLWLRRRGTRLFEEL